MAAYFIYSALYLSKGKLFHTAPRFILIIYKVIICFLTFAYHSASRNIKTQVLQKFREVRGRSGLDFVDYVKITQGLRMEFVSYLLTLTYFLSVLLASSSSLAHAASTVWIFSPITDTVPSALVLQQVSHCLSWFILFLNLYLSMTSFSLHNPSNSKREELSKKDLAGAIIL